MDTTFPCLVCGRECASGTFCGAECERMEELNEAHEAVVKLEVLREAQMWEVWREALASGVWN